MASASTPNYFGLAGGGLTPNGTYSTDTALFAKIFSSEVLTAFEQTTLMLDKHMVQSISGAKSKEFPKIGRISSAYHTPGAELTGLAVEHQPIVIYLDKLLVSHVFIAEIFEAMSHYDVRGPYATEMGRQLAYNFDQSVIMEHIRAAKKAPLMTEDLAAASKVQYLGASYSGFSVANKAAALATAIFTQAAIWDNAFIPGERYLLLQPVDYNALVQNTTAINADWGGMGAYSDGTVFKVGGVNIIKAPGLANTIEKDTTGNITGNTTNTGDAVHGAAGDTDVRAIMFTDQAVGTLKLIDIATESQWDIRRQGTLLVAKYAMGHGVLNQNCAAYFANDAS